MTTFPNRSRVTLTGMVEMLTDPPGAPADIPTSGATVAITVDSRAPAGVAVDATRIDVARMSAFRITDDHLTVAPGRAIPSGGDSRGENCRSFSGGTPDTAGDTALYSARDRGSLLVWTSRACGSPEVVTQASEMWRTRWVASIPKTSAAISPMYTAATAARLRRETA
jgi:hypothetical protein